MAILPNPQDKDRDHQSQRRSWPWEEQTWREEMRTALKTPQDLREFFNLPVPADSVTETYPIFIPLPLADLIRKKGPASPLWKQFVPSPEEDNPQIQDLGLLDPIGDLIHSQGGQLIHRYRNRLLFTPTTICPVVCRYCFRKNELSKGEGLFDPHFASTVNYLETHPEVEEIIFSGGDPLILSNEKLSFYLESFSRIKSLKYIRFHTRTPIVMPSRVTAGLLNVLRNFRPRFGRIILVLHVNHPEEISPQVHQGLELLQGAPIDLLSQTVLLKGVNDHPEVLVQLLNTLVDKGVRPYYLHHPDRVKGGLHFYLPLETGRRIYAQLRDHLPGWAIPHYVIDVPGGEGKISAFNPESFSYRGQLLNRKGELKSVSELPTWKNSP